MVRLILTTVIVFVAIILALVQFASDALYARIAAPHALVAHIPLGFGIAVYRALYATAPAEYVLDALASTALAQGDIDAAQRYAVQMPAGERRDGLLAQIAAARGDEALAREYDFAATDVAATQHAIAELARTNIAAAIAAEGQFRAYLMALGTHPDAVAQSYSLSGAYEAAQGHYVAALPFDERAVALAPMNTRYLLLAGAHAYFAGDLAEAERYFARGIAVNPADADAIAGLGLVALRQGDRARALADLARARAIDPRAPTVATLAAALR